MMIVKERQFTEKERQSVAYTTATINEMTEEFYKGEEVNYFTKCGFCLGLVYSLIKDEKGDSPEGLTNPGILAVNLYRKFVAGEENEELTESVDFRNAFLNAIIFDVNRGL